MTALLHVHCQRSNTPCPRAQVPSCVVDAVSSYMVRSYVQLGAGYEASSRASQTVQDAHEVVRVLMGAGDAGEVVLGPSTSQLLATIASSYAALVSSADSIIVHQASHEANAGPWVRLAQATGAKLVFWELEPGGQRRTERCRCRCRR